MKNIAYAFFGLLFVVKLQASNYYFSFSTGNDSNPINSQTTPWKTITKLNTLSLLPGDTVFFKRNDTWRGQINANQSGTLAKPIVYTAYSTGSMPKISGAELVSGWSAMGNYYTVPYTTTVGNFFIDDDEMTVARFPNSGYLIQSGSSQSTINSAQITQPEDYWAGTRVCVRTCQWVWETTAVNSSTSGGSLTVAPLLQISPIGNYGFFMYNKLAELDTAREWFYDTAADLLYYYPPTGQNPNSKICEAAVYDNGLQISDNVSNLVLENLWFDKQARNGIAVSNNTSTNIKVKYCTFTKQFLSGVLLRGNYHQVSNCFFRHCDGKGVEVTQGGKSIINHNVFRQIGRYKNSGSGKQTNLEAISLAFVDSVHVHHNNIDSVGYTGIHADGTNHIVEFNILANCMLLLNDGAPLKSFGAPSSNIIYRYNFVSATPGNTEGTYNANFLTPGIYFDFDVSSSLVAFNTIYNSPDVGIFFNGGTNNITALNNIVYGATHNAIFFNASSQPEPMNSMMVKHSKLLP
ncbi:MAG: right-handed parallel beta-helix repeat-containing protein [Sphingobacteriales bacterium]|nr:right-handed parallel beta-helix repeat-containing protein [Sphingobacteriales bacterium]